MIIKYNEFNEFNDSPLTPEEQKQRNVMFDVGVFLSWYTGKYGKELEKNDIDPEIVSEWFEENNISSYELIQDIDKMIDLLRIKLYRK